MFSHSSGDVPSSDSLNCSLSWFVKRSTRAWEAAGRTKPANARVLLTWDLVKERIWDLFAYLEIAKCTERREQWSGHVGGLAEALLTKGQGVQGSAAGAVGAHAQVWAHWRPPVSELPFWPNFDDIFMVSCKPVEIRTPPAILLNKHGVNNVKSGHDGYT